MEQGVKIKTKDNHIIYGILNSKRENNKVIVFVHGCAGSKNEHQFYNAARFFPKYGYDTFCFDLYSSKEKGRLLSNCSLETHCSDLKQVINFLKKHYQRIFLVGHSLGGPVILLAGIKEASSIVLWEPTLNVLEKLSSNIDFNKYLNKFILRDGVEYLVSKEMIEDWKKLDKRLLNYFQKPTKIICAEQSFLYKEWRKIINFIKIEHDFSLIKKAGHCFDEENAEKKLFSETLKWFNK